MKNISIVSRFYKKVRFFLLLRFFPGSNQYWEQRYALNGTSGPGSYNNLALFKAEVLNNFIEKNKISTIIEYGCGDGNQLKLAKYPHYMGFDISATAISLCQKLFQSDPTKTFSLMNAYKNEKAQMTLSLDVVYHLVEEEVFHTYMHRLFDSSERFVIIYSSDTDADLTGHSPYIKHRKFTKWVELHQSGWKLIEKIPNRHPYDGNAEEGSFADFFIFEKSIVN